MKTGISPLHETKSKMLPKLINYQKQKRFVFEAGY